MSTSKSPVKKVKKVIIPAAGWGTRFLPLTKIVDKELVPVINKPLLHYLIQEAIDAGLDEVILVLSSRKKRLMNYFKSHLELEQVLKQTKKENLLEENQKLIKAIKISYVFQKEQNGLAHAIASASSKIKSEPFAVILGDDLIHARTPVIKQLINAYETYHASIIGVQLVDNKDLTKYGVVHPINPREKNKTMFKIDGAVEKPQPYQAPSNKAILGRYVFTHQAMKIFKTLEPGVNGETQVVDAFEKLLLNEDIYAYEFSGTRYDLGQPLGFIKANVDYALKDDKYRQELKKYLKHKLV